MDVMVLGARSTSSKAGWSQGLARSCSTAAAQKQPPKAMFAPAAMGLIARPCAPSSRPQQQQRPYQRQRSKQRGAVQAAAGVDVVLTALQTPPVQDIAAGAFAVVGARALVRFFYLLESRDFIDQNTSRKLVHTLAGPLFLLSWGLFSSEPYARYIAAFVPLLNILRLLAVGYGLKEDKRSVMAMSRTGDPAELLRGPLYYAIVLLAVTVFYWRSSPVGLIVTSLMCGGDGLADLVGRRWGKSCPLPWNSSKSWAGSAAMLLGGFGFSMVFISLYSYLGYIDCELGPTALAAGTIALAATLIESLPLESTHVDDNLTVPGVAAFMGIMLLQVAVEFL